MTVNKKLSFLGKSLDLHLLTQRGLGLVELMVSLAIGLLILAGVLQLFATSQQTSITAEGASRLQENIRYTMARMSDDISRAGSMGCFSFSAANLAENGYINNNLSVAPGATNDALWSDFSGSFISGANDTGINGTDTLIVKYIDASSSVAITALPSQTQITLDAAGMAQVTGIVDDDDDSTTGNDVVFAGNCYSLYVFNISNISAQTVTMANGSHNIQRNTSLAYLYAGDSGAYEYSIRVGTETGSVCSATEPQGCSLFRSKNGIAQELVQGVSGLQVSYGDEDNQNQTSSTTGNTIIDRVSVTMTFTATDNTQRDAINNNNGNLLTKTVTRVFAVRNQL